jgi:hypothetical protein
MTVSSSCSGGEHDSTGLRAKQKLITPLLRCASPETATLNSELFETTQQNEKGSHRLPFLHFRRDRELQAQICRCLQLGLMCAAMRNLVVGMLTLP